MSEAFPAVGRDGASADFFDAAARGDLLVRWSPVSGTVLGPEARTDPVSGSVDLEPYTASGEGTLVTWAVVYQAPLPALAAAVPYVSAVVELEEGPWLMVRLLAGDPSTLRAGTPVRVSFVRSGIEGEDGEILPVFKVV